MLFRRPLILLLFLISFSSASFVSRSVFADYWVPKLDLELGFGSGFSKNDQQLGNLAILYELSQSWWIFGDYIYAQEGVHRGFEVNAVQRVSFGARYVLDFLRLKPWFSLRLGLSNRDVINPTMGGSMGLSYLLSEDWQLSLWTLMLVEPKLSTSGMTDRVVGGVYALISLSYSFVLGESFDEL